MSIGRNRSSLLNRDQTGADPISFIHQKLVKFAFRVRSVDDFLSRAPTLRRSVNPRSSVRAGDEKVLAARRPR